ncbi:Vetispiradiene synthase 1, variant 2 [Salvia divinorum]|uniref:Vetispiradiene synthase 1, variant 2 n=1 Tax=Salvia divinorum TaxID=28513 RepID=A0ABD1FMW9_SALDI
MASAELQNSVSNPPELVFRPSPNFSPSIWGDHFTSVSIHHNNQIFHGEEIEELKMEVRKMIVAAEPSTREKLNLIDSVERLGISYHFEKEIEEQLHIFHSSYLEIMESGDLHTVALCFRLLRQHGRNISTGIFEKFRGKFENIVDDDEGMLSLYEAANLRTHGEDVLEEALVFAKAHIESVAPFMRSPLKEQAEHALDQCLQRGVPRVEARRYMSLYEELESRHDALLKLAKLDFNLLQKLHRQELGELSRWDMKEIDRIPDYMKITYKALLELYDQYEQELKQQGRSFAVNYAKATVQEIVRSYNIEAKWFIEGYMPPFSEYMANGFITSTYYLLAATSFLGMASATNEAFDWLIKKPRIQVANATICRVFDDVATYEIEKKRGQSATGIECYMKDHGVSEGEAMEELKKMGEDAWKDMNGELWKEKSVSMEILKRIVNLSRLIDVVYKNNQDGYTHPEKVLKPIINALLVDSLH